MPELPEVETVRRALLSQIQFEVIEYADVYYSKIISNDLDDFKARIRNQVILDIDRKGKYLIFKLSNVVMIIHLRMEGKFYIKTNEPVLKHEHVLFHFKSGRNLRYHDVRKFGRIVLQNLTDYMDHPPLNQLADEPQQQDVNQFYLCLIKKRVAIKTALLDQRIISGLGNIYVDETLFLSRIHPKRLTSSLSMKEVSVLLESAQTVLNKAVDLGGSTIRSYTSTLGVHGRFQNELQVHTKQGEACPRCESQIVKIKVGGRGTYVCPTCQH
ncbi:MAG: DNA-formamidopyrimidine glycosylase [Acholeplasmataceae bacterium]|nr:DNA-formamidopyrimidine glycosylase [Acholeplasmataceae bacterium]